MTPSTWVSNFVHIKDGDSGTAKKMAFDERKYLLRPYDTPSRKQLFLTSRQAEKSTMLGNKLFSLSGMRPMYTSLFVTPSAMQTTVFSKSRIDDIIDISPLLKATTGRGLTMNLLEKEFVNKSKIYLRYAFLSADRIRGLSVNAIFGDEIQDLLVDVMPVIEETASHHLDPIYVYSGTPKTFDNNLYKYWSKSSTMSEWCIPCEHHGGNNPASWHWNVLGVDNLGKNGPICDRCGNAINPEHPYARWVEHAPGAEFEGFRICRLQVPWFFKNPEKWKEILAAYARYPTAQFMNEVMAISYDAGTKPITRAELIRACDPNYLNDEARAEVISRSHRTFFGIDWGTGEKAYTVLTVGAYCRDDTNFQIIFKKRFDGPLVDPERQLDEIERLVGVLNCQMIGADYGMGFYPNKRLINKYGPQFVQVFQYSARMPAKVAYSVKLHRCLVFRSPVMADVFHALKRGAIKLPCWTDVQEPFGSDILSIFSEYSETQKMLVYNKPRGATDDSFHSLLYCLLASMFIHKRPDIMAEIQTEGKDDGMTDFDLQTSLDIEVDPYTGSTGMT